MNDLTELLTFIHERRKKTKSFVKEHPDDLRERGRLQAYQTIETWAKKRIKRLTEQGAKEPE